MNFTVGPMPALMAFVNSDANVGSLSVLTNEDNVHVIVDGKEQRLLTKYGQLRIFLRTKEHVVRVFKEGYEAEPNEQRVQISKGQETKLAFLVRPPKPMVSSLVIQGAKLAGAQVSLDEKPIGKVQPDGSFSYADISPGDHAIELSLAQHRPQHFPRKFKAGEIVELTGIALEKVPQRAAGTLRLVLSPPDSVVTCRRIGDDKPQPIAKSLELEPGSYILTATALGYEPRSVPVNVVAWTKSCESRIAKACPNTYHGAVGN
jgi:hypothetical protein